MKLQILDIIQNGKLDYKMEYDVQSGIYFGLMILAIIFVYALFQALTRSLVGA